MEIHISPEQDGFIQYAITQGRYRSRQEVVDSALALWEERERERLELLEMLAEGDRSIDAGESIVIESEEDLNAFIEGIKRKGRAKLAQK